MPNLDGTGPEGKGPLTGLKRGTCKGSVGTSERPRMRQGLQGGRDRQNSIRQGNK